MAKYVFPAVFTREDQDAYSVNFPDVKNCFTGGESLADAIEAAEDVLGTMLTFYEDEHRDIPDPSDLGAISAAENEFVNYIACDTLEYRKKNSTRAVKKTLSIPEWLNELATEKGINFSQVLQEALKTQLGL